MPIADMTPELLAQFRGSGSSGITLRTSRREEVAVVTVMDHSRSGSDGTFRVPVTAEGDSILVVWERGFQPISQRLGSLGPVIRGLDLALGPPTGVRIRLTLADKLFPSHTATMIELVDADTQPALSLAIARDGTIDASSLVPGKRYSVMITGRLCDDVRFRFFEWKGETDLDLSSLPLTTDWLTEQAR